MKIDDSKASYIAPKLDLLDRLFNPRLIVKKDIQFEIGNMIANNADSLDHEQRKECDGFDVIHALLHGYHEFIENQKYAFLDRTFEELEDDYEELQKTIIKRDRIFDNLWHWVKYADRRWSKHLETMQKIEEMERNQSKGVATME